MGRSVAVVTMVYNEPDFLPLWVRYYGGLYGNHSCYVVDHGSDDHSTFGYRALNVMRIPRSPMHDAKRARFLSAFCSSLLEWYDYVIYTDVDEILVADPDIYSSLRDLTNRTHLKTITAVGLNIMQLPGVEKDFDFSKPVLEQRQWCRFSYSMCKTLVTSETIRWDPGFHSSDKPIAFDHLFLLHLHNINISSSLRRLAKTRGMEWGDLGAGEHQRWSDQQHIDFINAATSLPKATDVTFNDTDPILGRYLDWMKLFVSENPSKQGAFYLQNAVACTEIMLMPIRFRGIV